MFNLQNADISFTYSKPERFTSPNDIQFNWTRQSPRVSSQVPVFWFDWWSLADNGMTYPSNLIDFSIISFRLWLWHVSIFNIITISCYIYHRLPSNYKHWCNLLQNGHFVKPCITLIVLLFNQISVTEGRPNFKNYVKMQSHKWENEQSSNAKCNWITMNITYQSLCPEVTMPHMAFWETAIRTVNSKIDWFQSIVLRF